MALLEALLLDPYRMHVWVANRTDGVQGSGTQNDPFDGSTLSTTPISVTSLTRSGQTATATTSSNHGFQNGQLILIAGATGGDAVYYNGLFSIFNVTATTFQYTLWGTPASSPATGSITAQANPYQLDGIMRSLPISVTSITFSGTTATVTALNHGYATGNQVLIVGATGTDASKYNGNFSISNVTANTSSTR